MPGAFHRWSPAQQDSQTAVEVRSDLRQAPGWQNNSNPRFRLSSVSPAEFQAGIHVELTPMPENIQRFQAFDIRCYNMKLNAKARQIQHLSSEPCVPNIPPNSSMDPSWYLCAQLPVFSKWRQQHSLCVDQISKFQIHHVPGVINRNRNRERGACHRREVAHSPPGRRNSLLHYLSYSLQREHVLPMSAF